MAYEKSALLVLGAVAFVSFLYLLQLWTVPYCAILWTVLEYSMLSANLLLTIYTSTYLDSNQLKAIAGFLQYSYLLHFGVFILGLAFVFADVEQPLLRVLMLLANYYLVSRSGRGRSRLGWERRGERSTRRLSLQEEDGLLGLLEQGYFLCTYTKFPTGSAINAVFANRKGNEILNEHGLPFGGLCDALVEVEEPNRSLRGVIEDTLERQTARGLATTCWLRALTRKRSGSTESGNEREGPVLHSTKATAFNTYKAKLYRVTDTQAILVLSERHYSSTLNRERNRNAAVICTLSHEVKTLLNGLVGNLEILGQELRLEGENKVCFKDALCSSQLLHNKLSDFFDYLQLNSKEFKLHCGEFPLYELIDGVDAVCRWPAKKKQIQLAIHKAPRLPKTMFSDQGRVRQCLLNIVQKALDFTEYGRQVELVVARTKDRRVGFKVRSYGSEMAAKLHEHISTLSPTRDRSETEAPRNKTRAIENLEALSLHISQLVCKELGAKLEIKEVPNRYAQLKFAIRDGFPSAMLHPADPPAAKDRRASDSRADKSPSSPVGSKTMEECKEGEGEGTLLNKTYYGGRSSAEEEKAPHISTRLSDTHQLVPLAESDKRISISHRPEQNKRDSPSREREIPSEFSGIEGISLPVSPKKRLFSVSSTQDVGSSHNRLKCRPGTPTPHQSITKLVLKQAQVVMKTRESLSLFKAPEAPASPPKLPLRSPLWKPRGRRVTKDDRIPGQEPVKPSCTDDSSKCSVLIADDDMLNRHVLKAMLKRRGFNSIEACNGKEAATIVEHRVKSHSLGEISLIFMDLQMPYMNGIESALTITNICREANCPIPAIIGNSADPSETDRKNFLQAGIDEFISKPFTTHVLGQLIEKYVHHPK